MPAPELIDALVDAAAEYQRALTRERVLALIEYIRGNEIIETKLALRALDALRAKRWFDLLQSLADALIQSGQRAPEIRKLYAQALIDQGAISAAVAFLEQLVADSSDNPFEHRQARGLLGRTYKQSYVDGHGLSPSRREELMHNAIGYYYDVYREDSDAYWQGINVVALLARAARDGVAVSGVPTVEELAARILDTVTTLPRLPETRHWLFATAAEAAVGLGQWQEAGSWIVRFLKEPRTDAFEVGSLLRQFTEVWQLSKAGPEGAAIVEMLRAAALERQGGESVELVGVDAAQKSDPSMLQLVFGADRYQTLEWYRKGLDRSLAVARLGFEKTQGHGTGFIVQERDLDPAAGDGWVIVTNAHVLSHTYKDALRQNEAVVTFESLDGGTETYKIADILWSSPPDVLDATIARLDRNPQGVTPLPIAPALPSVQDKTRLYVIGHPRGGTLSFSIDDNLLIDHDTPRVHYRSPTDPGSSGSPVFNRAWSLVALHHAGSRKMRKLHGDPGTYEANEGLYIGEIADAFRRRVRN